MIFPLCSIVVACPVDPLIPFPPETCCNNLSPLQAVFTHVENTIAHQRCLGVRHKWEAKRKQGQNARLEWTATQRTMPANYSSQNTAEQTADLKRVKIGMKISHISCIKGELVLIQIIGFILAFTIHLELLGNLNNCYMIRNIICVHTHEFISAWPICGSQEEAVVCVTVLPFPKQTLKSITLDFIPLHVPQRRAGSTQPRAPYNEVRTRPALTEKQDSNICSHLNPRRQREDERWRVVICITTARHK